MRNPMMPDYMFRTFDEITPAFLASLGVKAILADIDNTLAPYEQPEPDERIRAWLDSLKKAGIKVVLVSNNHGDRIELFNRTLGLDAYADCKKPGKKRLGEIMKSVGATASDSAFLGDQIFTDVLSARNLGIKVALLVPPIKDKLTLFFRFKRWMEKPIIRRYYKIHGGDKK